MQVLKKKVWLHRLAFVANAYNVLIWRLYPVNGCNMEKYD